MSSPNKQFVEPSMVVAQYEALRGAALGEPCHPKLVPG